MVATILARFVQPCFGSVAGLTVRHNSVPSLGPRRLGKPYQVLFLLDARTGYEIRKCLPDAKLSFLGAFGFSARFRSLRATL